MCFRKLGLSSSAHSLSSSSNTVPCALIGTMASIGLGWPLNVNSTGGAIAQNGDATGACVQMSPRF